MAASLAASAASVALAASAALAAFAAFVEKEDWFRERRQFSITQKRLEEKLRHIFRSID